MKVECTLKVGEIMYLIISQIEIENVKWINKEN